MGSTVRSSYAPPLVILTDDYCNDVSISMLTKRLTLSDHLNKDSECAAYVL